MKYREKPRLVDAFQMTREAFEDSSLWPEWLGWKMGAVKTRINSEVISIQLPRQLALLVQHDDWLIEDQNCVRLMKPKDFAARYEPVGAEKGERE